MPDERRARGPVLAGYRPTGRLLRVCLLIAASSGIALAVAGLTAAVCVTAGAVLVMGASRFDPVRSSARAKAGGEPEADAAAPGDSGTKQPLALDTLILEHINDAVIVSDSDLVIRDCNPAAHRLLGFTPDHSPVASRLDRYFPESDAASLRSAITSAAARRDRWTGELRLCRLDGGVVVSEAVFVPLFDTDGTRSSIVAVCRDITDRREAEARLAFAANYDSLTGLPNHLLFRDRLGQALARAEWQHEGLAVLLLDIDNFELINTGLGRTHGDEMLRVMSQRLGEAVRRGDSLARVGGDKFALLQTGLSRMDLAALRARHLLDLIEPAIPLASRRVHASASVGIAVYPEDGTVAEDLIRNAGMALARAKAEGRGTYRMFVREMDDETRVRCALEHDAASALQRGEFLFHYQPQVDLISGRVVGCEALVRWQHPEYGLLYPDQFIPVAEESGSILALGEWGLREACRQLRRWDDAGLGVGRMAVNLSAVQFRYPDLAVMVSDILRETGADPRRLELEITESVALDDPELAASVMARIKALGVDFAIDDFGTGYSSLNYLKRFPARVLKVDRSLVTDLADHPSDAAIIRSVIALGHSLDMRVLAEGIENEAQLRFLRDWDCDLGQGRSFSVALAPGAFVDYLAAARTLAPL